MHIQKLAVAVSAANFLFLNIASAQGFSGSMGAFNDPPGLPVSTYTSSSVTLDANNLITAALTGTFLAELVKKSDLTAYAGTISGLSATPLADPIADFFMFSTPDSDFGTSGTTPNNRFAFNLATLAESNGSVGVFNGTGTLVDSLGVYSPTPGIFTLSFSGQGDYSFTMAAVPEPTTISLVALGLLGALAVRKRNSAS